MAVPDFEVVKLPELRQSTKRAIALLDCSHDSEVDAAKVYEALKQEPERLREVRSRLDMWIEGAQPHKRYFHGFDKEGYRDCFVFKWKQKNRGQRLYGFLCNPKPQTDKPFRLCVLTNHAEKAQWETDPQELDKANALRIDPHVKAAIALAFPDGETGKKQWH
jgi:hypothetical protein